MSKHFDFVRKSDGGIEVREGGIVIANVEMIDDLPIITIVDGFACAIGPDFDERMAEIHNNVKFFLTNHDQDGDYIFQVREPFTGEIEINIHDGGLANIWVNDDDTRHVRAMDLKNINLLPYVDTEGREHVPVPVPVADLMCNDMGDFISHEDHTIEVSVWSDDKDEQSVDIRCVDCDEVIVALS